MPTEGQVVLDTPMLIEVHTLTCGSRTDGIVGRPT
jgi:hypothetical protein